MDDYARWGVGLYKVVWESRDESGQILRQASGSIEVEGFPLATPVGVLGFVAIAIGLTALTFTLRTTINEGGRWAIKIVGQAQVESDAKQRRLTIKPNLSVSQTLLGTLWGLLLGGGTLTTLQETAITLPTIEIALELILPLTVIGFLAGSFRLARE